MTQLLQFMINITGTAGLVSICREHKGNFPAFRLTDIQRFDLTEIAGADSLYQANGAIRQLERQIADFTAFPIPLSVPAAVPFAFKQCLPPH